MLKNECIFCTAFSMAHNGYLKRFCISIDEDKLQLALFLHILQFTDSFRGLRVEFNQLNNITSRFFDLYLLTVASTSAARSTEKHFIYKLKEILKRKCGNTHVTGYHFKNEFI